MRLATRFAALASLLLVAAPASARSLVVPPGHPGASPLKRAQAALMAMEPMRERLEFRERARELRHLTKRLRDQGGTTLRSGGERARPDLIEEDARRRAGVAPAGAAAPLASALYTNVRCNNPSGDNPTYFEGQCETTIARWNDYLLAAWNDGHGFNDGSSQTQGWATSTDGGATWVDRGTFPVPASFSLTWKWSSDPVLAVNPTTGAFYFAALAMVGSAQSAVGVLKGRFSGTSFAWDAPRATRLVSTSTNFIDKEWIAVDPADGRVYLTYSDFHPYSDIYFQWSDSTATAWSTPRKISESTEYGWVQGSRPVVGAGNDVYVVYYLIGDVDADSYRLSRSADRGISFAAPTTAVSFYPNFGTGAPGFNRPMGIQFPSVVVDHSGGVHHGRLYLGWAESLNWFDDWNNVGLGGNRTEAEPNDTTTTATLATAGQALHGSMNTASDRDYFGFDLTAGQSIIVECDSMTTGGAFTLRMFARDGTTRLAYALPQSDAPLSSNPPLYAVWMFTAPSTGRYYVRVANTGGTGRYRLNTGLASRTTERGRDQRDVFVAWSDNAGTTWSTPVRINKEGVGFDDWLPEVAVAADGQVACAWYDWRGAAALECGGASGVMAATSDDYGVTWAESSPVATVQTNWSNVGTNIMPNQGDYIGLFSGPKGVTPCWADGRDGDPNTYMATIPSDRPVVSSIVPDACSITLNWYMNRTPGTTAAVYRQIPASSTWDSLTTITLDGAQTFSYTDNAVSIGSTYKYLLGVVTAAQERLTPYVAVTAPVAAQPVLQSTNATRTEVVVRWTLARNTATAVKLYRRSATAPAWDAPVTVNLDLASHLVSYTDTAVLPDSTYEYRLGVPTCGSDVLTSIVSVRTPGPELAIERVKNNPTRRNAAMVIDFSLPTTQPATLSIHDVTGRQIYSTPVTGRSFDVATAGRIRPGVYVVKLSQAGRSVTHRIVIL